MEPPVVPRTRLTRDYTAEDPLKTTSPSKGPMGLDTDVNVPLQRNSFEARPETAKPESDKRRTSRESGTRTPQGQDYSTQQGFESPSSSVSNEPNDDKENQTRLRKLDFNLEAIVENSSYEPSVSSISRASQNTGVTSTSGTRLPDFFGPEVFQIVLHNPTTSHQLLKFSRSRLAGENMEFLDKVDKYNTLLNEVAKYMFEIHRDYISVTSDNQINLPESLLIKVNKDLKAALASTLPKLETVFVDSQNEIERLVSLDIYPRFVRHQLTMSATKALADSEQSKYAGLGDCFVLTDPVKADNPIVFASDGFVKVTGYARTDIIPRNCRFLQMPRTDPAAVKRLRVSLENRQENVELLLNAKKNGEPFWNLLYTTPLFDASGNVVFFLGGQINFSTAIHNTSDVLKILAQSGDTDERAAEAIAEVANKNGSTAASRASKFFNSFRSSSYRAAQMGPYYRPPGMEDGLLNKMERMNLRKQMDTFYTAYSKYIVINYTTWYITFHSAGIATLLYPTKPPPGTTISTAPPTGPVIPIVGTDIFRFLAAHSPSSKLSSDFKSRVRGALRVGRAISLDLHLCTRRHMGFERFVAHWTPLKDDKAATNWVVVTLGAVGE